MPTIDAMQAMANAQKEFVQSNKENHDKFFQAVQGLGAQQASRISDSNRRFADNEGQLIGTQADKDNIAWDSSIGIANAAVGIGQGAATGSAANTVDAVFKAVGAITNLIAQLQIKDKEIQKFERLKNESSKDGGLAGGATGL